MLKYLWLTTWVKLVISARILMATSFIVTLKNEARNTTALMSTLRVYTTVMKYSIKIGMRSTDNI